MFNSAKEIDHIGKGLVARTLPKTEWTHAAHFAAAVWLIHHPEYEPVADMPDIIRRYNEATGVPNTDTDGYHETITLASLRVARAFYNSAPEGTPVFEIVNTLMASEYGRSNWLLEYWHKDNLFSSRARRTWVDADKADLPF